jgi:hypothetical protein
VHVLKNSPAHPLYAFISEQERQERRTARLVLDATWPWHWPAEQVPRVNDFAHAWPEAVREAARAKWERALAAGRRVVAGV